VDTNLAVGTIIGIYKGQGVIGRKGSEQVASLLAIYGPRLTFMITIGDGVHEFLYSAAKDTFVMFNQNLKIADEHKMFSPGNLNVSGGEEWYMNLLKFWIEGGYKLRYSGCMAADVNQLMKKGGGVFSYPGTAKKPEGKLRLIYECAPVAMLIEQAGGSASSGNQRILDMVIESFDHQSPIFVGSKKEVEIAEKYLKGVGV